MEHTKIIQKLKRFSKPDALRHMAKFGINVDKALGVSIPDLRKTAKEVGTDHSLAENLWESGIHDARILASMIDEPKLVSKSQMNRWVKDFNSWDLCDQCCNNLFVYTPFAYELALTWSQRKAEFEKRAGFVMMAVISVHLKDLRDEQFAPFFERIKNEAADPRNFVKKSVNWALRGIGKRNLNLLETALKIAEELSASSDKSERWVGADAKRELLAKKEKWIAKRL